MVPYRNFKIFPFYLTVIFFCVQIHKGLTKEVNRCDAFTDPCLCSFNKNCKFEELYQKCVPVDVHFLNRFTCQRSNVFYAFSSSVICKSPGHLGNCSNAVDIYSVNLNGDTYKDSNSVWYKSESSIITLDKDLNVPYNATCKITGLESEEDADKLYRSMVEGSPSLNVPGSCVSYPIPILQDGEYELTIKFVAEIGKCVDIKFADVTVAFELNLMSLADENSCQAVDLVVFFLVNQYTQFLLIKGRKIPIRINGGFSLKFCFGECDNIPNASYRASAFSLVRFGQDSRLIDNVEVQVLTYGDGNQIIRTVPLPLKNFVKVRLIAKTQLDAKNVSVSLPTSTEKSQSSGNQEVTTAQPFDNCDEYKNDVTTCKFNGCEYNLSSCVAKMKDCSDDLFKDPSHCRRKGAFYVSNGVLCKNRIDGGECSPGKVDTKLALNFGGPTIQYRGITYKQEKDGDYDKSSKKFRISSNFVEVNKQCTSDGDRKDDIFKKMMGSIIFGGWSTAGRGCLIYPFKLKEDGQYEISIFATEGAAVDVNKRFWDIQFNKWTIIYSIDLFRLHGKKCEETQIIIRFKLVNGATEILFDGFSSPIKLDGQMQLKFCNAYVNPKATVKPQDIRFQVSAFSISKLWTKESGGKIEATTTGPQHDLCEDYKNDITTCKMNGCEFNVVTSNCVYKMKDCSDDLFKDPLHCRRKEAFYVKSGIICKNHIDGGECSPENVETRLALNFGGATIQYRGITYKQESEVDFDEASEKFRVSTNFMEVNKQCTSDDDRKDDIFKKMMSSIIYGGWSTVGRGCLIYPFALHEDGHYEISIFATEGAAVDVNKRFWDIQFNKWTIIYSIDLFRLNGKKCQETEIIMSFKLKNFMTEVLFDGFPHPMKLEGKMQLKFCNAYINPNATAKPQDIRFQVSAFSISKLLKSPIDKSKILPPVNSCEAHGSNKTACKKDNCEFSLVSEACISKLVACSNKTFDGYTNCRRALSVYASGGVACRNKKASDKGTCNGETVLALNLAGKEWLDTKRSIKYAEELQSHYKDTENKRMAANFEGICKVASLDAHFKNLLATVIYSNATKHGCISYPVNLRGDGAYELSVIGMEHHFKYGNMKPYDIMINDVMILNGVDNHLISGRICRKSEIIVLFKVENGGSQLTPMGFTAPIDIDAIVNLKMCLGYEISAISVVKFGE